jgi:hypothetical protein
VGIRSGAGNVVGIRSTFFSRKLYMPISELRLIKSVIEFEPLENIKRVPIKTRGIYALYHRDADGFYNLVYIGMARGQKSGIRGRLAMHSKRKRDLWTHYSMFEVWDNISQDEIEELEGLFRHLFRLDATANRLNKQKGYKKLGRLRKKTAKQLG